MRAVILLALMVLTACGYPSPVQLQATAQVAGCWPYGFPRPNPTRTPVGVPTPSVTPTTATAMPTCTPAPETPTLTPTIPPTLTPWTRPTDRPPLDTTSQLINVSNMPGADSHAAVALHPSEGWAALAWVNVPPDAPDQAVVYVKAQDARTKAWRRGVSVTTQPAYGFASHPDLAIDEQGHIHAFFGQDPLKPHYSRSTDGGQTWTEPEALPLPAGYAPNALYGRIAVDPAGHLHVFYALETGAPDSFAYIHLQRPADADPGTPWHVDTGIFPGEKHVRLAIAFVPLANGQVRTVAVTGCNRGCGAAQPIVATQEGSRPWRVATIPGATDRMPEQNINWTSALSFRDRSGQQQVCIAWGNYAASGTFASCSRDGGRSWGAAETIVFTPATEDEAISDRGSTPELIYEPTSDTLMAVQIYRQAGTPATTYVVYSYRHAAAKVWLPIMDGPTETHEPALRLFPQTRRSLADANAGIRVAYAGSGLALAAWSELEADENGDVYLGWFNPSSLLAEVAP
ncbi:MAG TPA: hypothetical protein VFZ66_19110 [Herpetosiphonaceae bacterium]